MTKQGFAVYGRVVDSAPPLVPSRVLSREVQSNATVAVEVADEYGET